MIQYLLMKSEPDVWSMDQQIKAGLKGGSRDGVRNYQAAKNSMELSHLLLIKQSRLSIMTIDHKSWKILNNISKI